MVSASVTNATGNIENLKECVAVTLHHLTAKGVSGVLRNVQELKKKTLAEIIKLSLPLTEGPECPVCLLGFQ